MKPNDSLDINVLFQTSPGFVDYEKELIDSIIIKYFNDYSYKIEYDTLIVKARVTNEKKLFCSGFLNETEIAFYRRLLGNTLISLRLNNTFDSAVIIDSVKSNSNNENMKIYNGLDNCRLSSNSDTAITIISVVYKIEYSYIDVDIYYHFENDNISKILKQRTTYHPVFYDNDLIMGIPCLILSSCIGDTVLISGLGVENSSQTKYKLDTVKVLNPDSDYLGFEIRDSIVYDYSKNDNFVDFYFTPKDLGLKDKLFKFSFSGENGIKYSRVFILSTLGMEKKLGINEISNNAQISLFPNPVIDELSINFNGLINIDKFKLKIYDLLGNCLVESNCFIDNCRLNVSFLKRGTYYLFIETNKSKTIKRFVKL